MQRLGIAADSTQVISNFKGRASAKQRTRLEEVIASFEDGSWDGRWWPCPEHASDSDFCELHPGEGLLILFGKIYDEEARLLLANIIYIDTDPRHDEPRCTIPSRFS